MMMKGLFVGKTEIFGKDDNDIHIGFIQNLSRFEGNRVGGVQERGLNSAINVAKSLGKRGVVSGEEYQNAPLQLHVIEKFPNRTELVGRGAYSNYGAVKEYRRLNNITPSALEEPRYVNTIEEMKEASPDKVTFLVGDPPPAFLLEEGNMVVPTKASIFDPRRITPGGELPFDWYDSYIFRRGGVINKQ